MSLYAVCKALVSVYYRSLYRVRVEGHEHIPPEGGVIVCGNHFTANDPFMVAIAMKRPISYMAKQELFKNPLVGWLLRRIRVFPVKRGQPDRAAIKHSIEVLHSGTCFGIFPEGTRNRTGHLGKAEPGTAYLAIKSGAPVVPVGITSSYKLFGPILVRFGRPVDLSPYMSGKLTQEAIEGASHTIMAAIGMQLDPPVNISVAAGKQADDSEQVK